MRTGVSPGRISTKNYCCVKFSFRSTTNICFAFAPLACHIIRSGSESSVSARFLIPNPYSLIPFSGYRPKDLIDSFPRQPLLPRKEVIQPHLPIRLPCYDFTPVISPAFGSSLLAVGSLTSGVTDSHGVTGGVYKTRERIHRDILIRDY